MALSKEEKSEFLKKLEVFIEAKIDDHHSASDSHALRLDELRKDFNEWLQSADSGPEKVSVHYTLELYNEATQKYEHAGEWLDLERAEIAFTKPYYQSRTRRLLKITNEIVMKATKKNAQSI